MIPSLIFQHTGNSLTCVDDFLEETIRDDSGSGFIGTSVNSLLSSRMTDYSVGELGRSWRTVLQSDSCYQLFSKGGGY